MRPTILIQVGERKTWWREDLAVKHILAQFALGFQPGSARRKINVNGKRATEFMVKDPNGHAVALVSAADQPRTAVDFEH